MSSFLTEVGLGSRCPQQDACADANAFCSSSKCVCRITHYDDNGATFNGGSCIASELNILLGNHLMYSGCCK